MGGLGSGNHDYWGRPGKKTVVEECLSLDANYLARKGILKANVRRTGDWHWTEERSRRFTIRYEVNTLDLAAPSMRLTYSWVWGVRKEPQSADYRVRLTTTRPRFGGLRWWFVCPLVGNDGPCNRRVGKLYLPPSARSFGCRHCHKLTYRCCQEHDKRGATFEADLDSIVARLAKLKARDLGS